MINFLVVATMILSFASAMAAIWGPDNLSVKFFATAFVLGMVPLIAFIVRDMREL